MKRAIAALAHRLGDWLEGKSLAAGVTVKHPPSMADEVEAMRREQEHDVSNVELIGGLPVGRSADVLEFRAAHVLQFKPRG